MANVPENSPDKTKKKAKLFIRLLFPMLGLVLFQLVTFFAVLIAGGEFSHVKEYAYSMLLEKTENRKNYIESEFQSKIPFVQEAAEKINTLVETTLIQKNVSVAALQEDKELNRKIMESSAETLIDLLKRSMANDVYFILETGDLYDDEGGVKQAKAALYFRDLDPTSDSGYQDLLMEMGLSSISQDLGIILDSGWKLHFESDPNNMENYDYYYRTIQTAEENSNLSFGNLGYWSGFSPITKSAADSMKYTVPLIAADGTVYGVIGIGLTENTILSDMPVNDFLNETACYVLGRKQPDSQAFDIITHSGIAFNQLVKNENTLQTNPVRNEGIVDFTSNSEFSSVGSVQYMKLYSEESPYYEEQWALISVAEKDSVLQLFTNLIRMLVLSAVIALVVSTIIVLITIKKVVEPITKIIHKMNSMHEYNQIIRFAPTNIFELDKMTDAITQLQINAQEFSSQVSKMIRIADVGLGTFMYDHTAETVFVGQGLLKLLNLPYPAEEDIMISRQEFIDHIPVEKIRSFVLEGLAEYPENSDYVKEFSIHKPDGGTNWLRLSLVHNKNKSIGIIQDITSSMLEKKRIEYERDYDSTTGLLNRHAYYRKIEDLFRHRNDLKITAFIMLDLDNLKYVNDTYGHDFGDDYIKTAANSLKNFQRYGGIVSRLSGDEFNICLTGFSSKEEVRKIIQEVRSQLLNSYCLLADGTHFKIRASAGISWYPDDADSYEMLVKYADFAMYTIKHSTKGEIAEFDISSYAKDAVLLNGVEEMNRIIDECRVRYAFHSIVSAKTGELYGYEALMRPQSSIFQSPLELLRIAKTSAKLYEIEHLTWTKALVDFQAQIDAGNISPDCHLFVNSISNCILEDSDVHIIEKNHPNLLSHIIMEILESESTNEEYIQSKINRMRTWNAQVALDDFGTGYNSEYALITLNPNIIKIDRSLVSGCDKDFSRRTIISNLVKLVRHKNILVLAEGVETESEVRTVISCGVDLLQGYYINRPVFEPKPVSKEVKETIRRFSHS